MSDFGDKIKSEEKLTAFESERLDVMLKASAPVKNWVADLEDEPLSMAWTSDLNEKLLALDSKTRQSWFSRVMKGRAWLGWTSALATGGLAIVLALNLSSSRSISSTGVDGATGPTLEETLLTAHTLAEAQAEVSNLGPSRSVASKDQEDQFEWTSDDLANL